MQPATWEHAIEQLQALGHTVRDVTLKMRVPGNWFAIVYGVEIASPDAATVHPVGNGRNPASAVFDLWEKLVDVEAPYYVTTDAFDRPSRWRWTQNAWHELPVAVR